VNRGTEQTLDILDRRSPALPADFPDLRNGEADEHVTLGVLAGSGLEESLQ
jgi:hypothetical protein